MSQIYKKWYESKTIWGGLITILSIVIGVFGYTLSPEDAELLVGAFTAIGAAVGGIVGIVGRVKATKAIR